MVWANTSQLAQPSGVCACAGVAQGMFEAAKVFNQPLAAWDVGQVVDMEVRRRPHWVCQRGAAWVLELHGQAWGDFLYVCGGTVRRRCSTAHTGSTSPWLRGTLVRSPPWRCAAAHVEAGGGRPSAHKPARRRICFTTRPISTSPWLHGTLARSPACGCAAACLSGQEGLGGSRAHLLLGEAASRACVLWRGAGDVQRPHRFDWLQPVAHPREL